MLHVHTATEKKKGFFTIFFFDFLQLSPLFYFYIDQSRKGDSAVKHLPDHLMGFGQSFIPPIFPFTGHHIGHIILRNQINQIFALDGNRLDGKFYSYYQ